jgi:hypothetical protein
MVGRSTSAAPLSSNPAPGSEGVVASIVVSRVVLPLERLLLIALGCGPPS